MRVTLSWLKEYVEILESAEEIASLLTHQGLEVSSCTPIRPDLDGVTTCRILSEERHPEVEKLWVCRVDAGRGERVVLCGAPNVKRGAIAVLASPGARLADGKTIEAVSIRGILSEGMLCSEAELGLSEDPAGILLLSDDVSVGRNLTEALSLEDYVLDVEITPNRPDCLCVLGIAREIAAKKGLRLMYPEIAIREDVAPAAEVSSVKVLAPDLCHRYVARILSGVRIAPSPFWLRRRLSLVGLRPINNVVDATNFVMWEFGQPLHAFDMDRLQEQRIVVRRASQGEKLTTLDGTERALSPEDLLICDARIPVALAGIMGGQESEIKEDTVRILLESAFFEPRGIRRTAKRLGLSTEASYRFEREIDKEGVLRAGNRAVQIMLSLAGGSLLAGALDVYPNPYRPRSIGLTVSGTNRLLGTSLERKEIHRILTSLEFRVTSAGEEALDVTPPPFRPDIREAPDLTEEVARLHGYDRIPTQMPRAPLSVPVVDPEKRAEERIRDLLIGLGFQEVVQYSFVSHDRIELMGFSSGDARSRPVALQNPLSEAQSVLRTTLVSSLLDTVSRNLRRNNRDLQLFELGRVFLPSSKGALPEQKKMLAVVLSGRRYPDQWNQPPGGVDAYDLKGVIEVLLDAFGVQDFEWTPLGQISSLHPGCSGDILIKMTKVGYAGRLHPVLQERFEIDQDVYLFEMQFDCFLGDEVMQKVYRPIGRFPSVQRDIALVMDEGTPFRQVMKEMWAATETSAVKIELFDVYQGPPVPDGQKSLAFRITYQDPSRTLTDEEVNALQGRFLDRVLPMLKAQLR